MVGKKSIKAIIDANTCAIKIFWHSGNASYPLQPPVKHKNNCMGKHNLFIVGDSHIKRIERGFNCSSFEWEKHLP